MKKVIKNILFFTWSLLRQKKEQQHLFLMAHPRSGSSLLMHILTTNKSIAGFGEYLTKYINNSDFLKSEFDIRRKTLHFFKNYLYIANQINHHSITPNKEICVCGSKSLTPKPAKFSIEDKYGSYRRKAKLEAFKKAVELKINAVVLFFVVKETM